MSWLTEFLGIEKKVNETLNNTEQAFNNATVILEEIALGVKILGVFVCSYCFIGSVKNVKEIITNK